MVHTDSQSEYLQAIWTLADDPASSTGPVISARLAEFLGVSGASVSEMIHRLERDGLVRLNGRKEIALTESGTELAARVVRRHRLIERMLTDLLGYDWWATHDEAERLEHAISPEMERRLTERLGDPATCPHGNPMPGRARDPRSHPLAQAEVGAAVIVERIPDQFEHEPGFLRYLDEQGLRPGQAFRVARRAPAALEVEIGGRRRSIRADCDQKVWVRLA
ncbi:MAG TPA: metal-dependent transcriptional regulator [Candidatus Dormibacteraeota bacterium]|jgi:DtxR family Mn-dependent transcriptional regulator|nr:metal-dependent transcriptional regulator [Candidatus Dormibacteraeota bacterium]